MDGLHTLVTGASECWADLEWGDLVTGHIIGHVPSDSTRAAATPDHCSSVTSCDHVTSEPGCNDHDPTSSLLHSTVIKVSRRVNVDSANVQLLEPQIILTHIILRIMSKLMSKLTLTQDIEHLGHVSKLLIIWFRILHAQWVSEYPFIPTKN